MFKNPVMDFSVKHTVNPFTQHLVELHHSRLFQRHL